ncbi:hypothetical protein IPS36_21520 [Xanthomonas perforans]|uniref:Uncharacterized protein n=2 Tax=Xanthomonas TaxID=338 RepID=A0A6P0FI15_XANPE|nr:hypothetical protein [Xanthomonas perforans]MBZ2418874.1 hypothetical protein [Xanthomonas perforans]MBZ2436028.1 hypothetical protein [Xanthomonas perforans]MBZ2444226.1 hypothetical protein [Xanthomonas perforans]MBZ2465435.1 hypothetical protein [Xanthomonas perforans]MBZ2482931.1 hypothetical protein [Xanthomonas perforans]
MYIQVLGVEVKGDFPKIKTSCGQLKSVMEAAFSPKTPIEKFMSPRGSLRYMDPLALWIAELAERSDVDVTGCGLNFIGLGATRHYFEVTRRFMAGEAFSPLAYSNRSCNAVAAQVSQLLGIKNGAAAYYANSFHNIFNVIKRRVQQKGPLLICGGRIRGASTPPCFYGPDQGVDYCYCLRISESKVKRPFQWHVSLEAGRKNPSGVGHYDNEECGFVPCSATSLGPLTPLILGVLYGANHQDSNIRVLGKDKTEIDLILINQEFNHGS